MRLSIQSAVTSSETGREQSGPDYMASNYPKKTHRSWKMRGHPAVVGQIVLSNLGVYCLAQFGVFGRFREAIAIVQLWEHIKPGKRRRFELVKH